MQIMQCSFFNWFPLCILYFVDNSPRAATLTRCLEEMIVSDLQPLSTVEDEGFKAFVRALGPKYRLPGKKKLTETHLVNMFNECKGKVMEALQNAPGVVLTTDVWTSMSTEVYLSVTCHVIHVITSLCLLGRNDLC